MPAGARRTSQSRSQPASGGSRKRRTAAAPVAAAQAAQVNEAAGYGVRVIPADVAPATTYWQAVQVRHLTPEENQGKHNVFVDAVDENGQRVRDSALRIGWTWEGRHEDEHVDPKPLDKPDSEPAGNVDINNTGTHLAVWLQGDGLASDRVENLHTNHPDEPASNGQLWNSIGHHSFYVRFQRAVKQGEEGEGGEETTPFRFEAWPTESKVITQAFGARPEYYAQWQLPGHEGIDIAAVPGSQIFAVAPGEVYDVHDQDDGHVYGIHVRVSHRDGYRTVYAHLQEARVSVGQQVAAGQVLGLAGLTGNTDGPHLHLSLKRDGMADPGYPNDIIDPTAFLMPLLGEPWLDARYVRDTVPDFTAFRSAQRFVQTWTLQNNGTRPWEAGFRLARVAGDTLGAPDSVDLPPANPGATVEVAITFEAPAMTGSYRSVWQPVDAAGVPFGDPVWTAIVVASDFTFLPFVGATPEAAAAPMPALSSPSLQASLRFLVRLGAIYESAMARLPSTGDAEEVAAAAAALVDQVRDQVEDLLEE